MAKNLEQQPKKKGEKRERGERKKRGKQTVKQGRMNQSQCGENLGIFLNNLKEPKNEAKKKNNKNEKGNKKRQILEQPQKKLLETFKRLKEAHNRTKNPSIPPPCPTSTPNISKESRNIFNYPKSRLPPSPPTHPAWERWRYSNNPGRVFFLGNLETVSSQLKRISTFIPRLSVSVPPPLSLFPLWSKRANGSPTKNTFGGKYN